VKESKCIGLGDLHESTEVEKAERLSYLESFFRKAILSEEARQAARTSQFQDTENNTLIQS
jgi:hypothetical protein